METECTILNNNKSSMGKKLSDLSPEDKLLRAGQTFIWKREKEYIDKAVLIKAIEEACCDVMADYGPEYGVECGFSREAIKKIVQDCPTAEFAEVRHGEWVHLHWHNSTSCADCSECGFEAQHSEFRGVQKYYKLCPNCGAKMDGGNENAVD